MIATKFIPNDIEDEIGGACYTYGAPRVGDYEFFFGIKTPVYRVVNSGDIVPRVPPGVGMQALIMVSKGLQWLFSSIPPLKACFTWLERFFDKLQGYRHYGDLRYLTSVTGGRFKTVRLLYNPPAGDRIRWFLKHIGQSLFIPVKMHNMDRYRKKLIEVAIDRNKRVGN